MLWQIKLQNRRTCEVDPDVLRQFDDKDIEIVKESKNDFRRMIDEINAELSEETKNHKMLLVCNEESEHFVQSYIKDTGNGKTEA